MGASVEAGRPAQVVAGDGVGLVGVHVVVVVGLKADGGDGPGHLLHIPRTRSGRKVSYTISPVRKSYRAEPLDRMTGALMGTLRAWVRSWAGPGR